MDNRDKIAEKYGLSRVIGELSNTRYESWTTGKDRLFYVYMHDSKEYRIQSAHYNEPSKTGHINFNELHFTDFEKACQVCRVVLLEFNMKNKYKFCNHHHALTNKHEIVDFGEGEFVANKEAIPLLKALNEIGLMTRSHHIGEEKDAWVCILLDNVEIEIKDVFERDSTRTKYNGKKELLISWKKK